MKCLAWSSLFMVGNFVPHGFPQECVCSVPLNVVIQSGHPINNPCVTTLKLACASGSCEPVSACTFQITQCDAVGDCCKVVAVVDLVNTVWIGCPGGVPNGPGVDFGGLGVACGHWLSVWFLAVTSNFCNENAAADPYLGQTQVILGCLGQC
jgi:hypothetical protein